MRATWTCLLVLASCSFIDDFDRFRVAPAEDGGADHRDAARGDAAARDPSDAASDPEAGTGDAQVGARDARVDSATPADGSRPTDANASPGCGAAGSDPFLTCYPDIDGDSFPNLAAQPTLACRCEGRTVVVAEPQSAQADCWDDLATRGADVFPGQTKFFDRGYGAAEDRYDFDCDGTVTFERGVYANDCAGLLGLACADRAGFGAATACGVRATYVSCMPDSLLACQSKTDQRTQACR